MTQTQRLLAAGLVLGLAGAGTAVVLTAKRGQTPPVQPSAPAQPATTAPVVNRPTSSLAGYASWPVPQQRQALADLEQAPVLDAETIRFLRHLVSDRTESPNARNLAANALTAPGRWVRGLAPLFLAQAREPAEHPTWRDYALQHAQTVAARGEDVELVVTALRETVLAGGPTAGTALLMLQRLQQSGRTDFDSDVLAAAAAQVFAKPEADINATMAVLGVLGERRDSSQLAGVRSLLSAAVPALRRTACGTIGQIGVAADAALVAALIEDPDASVAAAAAIARDRIQSRSQP